jgi:sec-independent protein translocase protein TatA
MFGIGSQELLVILLVVLLLFGGKRIPEIARSLGGGLRDFRKAMHDVQREVDVAGLVNPPPEPTNAPVPAPHGEEPTPAPPSKPTTLSGGEGI